MQNSPKWATVIAAKDEALAAKDEALAAKERALVLSERLAAKELALFKIVSVPCQAPRVQGGGWRPAAYSIAVPCKRRSMVI